MEDNTAAIAGGVLGVFVGCCLNAVFLEYLVKADPGSGTLTTFAQYIVIAIEGIVITTKFFRKKREIPIWSYLNIVLMFLTANVANNYVFKFNISMPLHMIFRSGSLITNMVMGVFMLNKKYTLLKFFSVSLISLGVLICTLITGNEMKKDTPGGETDDSFFWWTIGISILVIALFVSSLLGIYQEKLYAKYGKHPDEALFYTHLLPLPAFLLFSSNIVEHFDLALKSPGLSIPFSHIAIPSTLFYLLGNALSQYMCIKSVYLLTTEASSLSVTLVLTLRKFFSLILSILYFNNNFTLYHWIGTLCVFVGTLIFTEIPQKMLDASRPKKKVS